MISESTGSHADRKRVSGTRRRLHGRKFCSFDETEVCCRRNCQKKSVSWSETLVCLQGSPINWGEATVYKVKSVRWLHDWTRKTSHPSDSFSCVQGDKGQKGETGPQGFTGSPGKDVGVFLCYYSSHVCSLFAGWCFGQPLNKTFLLEHIYKCLTRPYW